MSKILLIVVCFLLFFSSLKLSLLLLFGYFLHLLSQSVLSFSLCLFLSLSFFFCFFSLLFLYSLCLSCDGLLPQILRLFQLFLLLNYFILNSFLVYLVVPLLFSILIDLNLLFLYLFHYPVGFIFDEVNHN